MTATPVHPHKTVALAAVRADLTALIDHADDDPVVITRNGHPIAALVSLDALATYERFLDQQDAELARRALESDDGTRYSLAEVMAETLERNE